MSSSNIPPVGRGSSHVSSPNLSSSKVAKPDFTTTSESVRSVSTSRFKEKAIRKPHEVKYKAGSLTLSNPEAKKTDIFSRQQRLKSVATRVPLPTNTGTSTSKRPCIRVSSCTDIPSSARKVKKHVEKFMSS